MTTNPIAAVILSSALAGSALAPQSASPLAALARMPIKEVTIFKDGHAFVLHEGTMPTDPSGDVQMDYLPEPVLGTFWPYSADKNVKLTSVVASKRRVTVEQTALNLAQLLEANTGVDVIITERSGSQGPNRYAGTLLGIPVQSSEELAATGIPNAGEKLPEKGDVILVKTTDGVKVVIVQNVLDVTFKTAHKTKLSSEEFRNLLTLKLDWAGRRPEKTAGVGLVYLEKGIRWVPNYKVTIDGKGNAIVRLQATLINELADLDDVTANLVIGVPTFAFKDTLDPMSLQKTATQLSQYFQGDRSSLSNTVAFQTARMTERAQPAEPPAPDLGPEVTDSTKSEDFFVFTVRHISLKKGARMALPVAQYTLKYRDVYTLELPFAPPADFRLNLNSTQQAELARLMSVPKVSHKIRLVNQGNQPLTTAPALVIRDERVLAQGMMTYTAPGASMDLEIASSVDIQVTKRESETKRTPNAQRWQGDDYARVDLEGTIGLTNYRGTPVDLEITRQVLGNVTSADHGGAITRLNVIEQDRFTAAGSYPAWWGWYSWPSWWHRLNGIGRITWTLPLEPGKSLDLGYAWHYFCFAARQE